LKDLVILWRLWPLVYRLIAEGSWGSEDLQFQKSPQMKIIVQIVAFSRC